MMTGGILNLRKPPGLTSHDMVDRVRRILGRKRVGHGGTLDPFADGVLLMGFGSGTKILPYLSDLPKEYLAALRLGESTKTLDTEGEVTARRPVPPLSDERIREVLASFRGKQEQMPPAYSAIKVGGVRSYQLAREGISVALPPRSIMVEKIFLLAWEPPIIRFVSLVSKGTYMRRLASDLAEELGTCGYLVSLTRTAVGGHTLDASLTLLDLERAASSRKLAEVMIPPASALGHLPKVRLDDEGVRMIRNGLYPSGHFTLEATLGPEDPAAAVDEAGQLVAVLKGAGDRGRADWLKAAFLIDRVIAD